MAKYSTREITSPRTHTSYVVGTAAATGADASGGRFVTICDAHHTVLNSRTWQLALDAVFYPEWCSDCQPKLAGPCPVLNGSYACSLLRGHVGSHLTAAQGGRRFRFADKYSAVVPA